MDQKRLLLALVFSFAVLAVFTVIQNKYLPHPQHQTVVATQAAVDNGTPAGTLPGATSTVTPPAGPRLAIEAPLMQGSVGLTGAVFDDITLTAYHETDAKNSPLVQIMGRRGGQTPTYAQFGWSAATGIKVPDDATIWTSSAPQLTPSSPVTLSWDNGQGLTFQLLLSVDDKYMFTVRQNVINSGTAPVALYPWSRVVRDFKPKEPTSWVLFDGPLGVFNGTLQQESYKSLKNDGTNAPGGVAFTANGPGGWAGVTDKYWLAAVAPDQSAAMKASMTYGTVNDGDGSAYQSSFIAANAITAAPGGDAEFTSHLFTGAKVVKILDFYQNQYGIPNLYKAVDFGHLYILTKPIFYALDYLNSLTGNFGVAILIFTVGVKLLFFPLASYSYRSMARMKNIQPRIKLLREKHEGDNVALQQATMALYKEEKINPASGCLPMLVQIPVFFSLYKVIYITIEMRQAPFYGWIHDLSAPDPTNLFNAFGLIPFDPTSIAPFLNVGLLPIIMGFTMFLQQRLNPPAADPAQARMFQFMPLMFTFMLAHSPAGLVLYWAWNNLLSVGQQWLIMRRATPKTTTPAKA
jgi:YidC/Oxa1 family membrane protein insertase